MREASRRLDALVNEGAGGFTFRSTHREPLDALSQSIESCVAGVDEMQEAKASQLNGSD